MTVHATHGLDITDNVAHDTYGHCFFLEDGGEKDNLFDGNLGLTTRKGFLTPSDSEVGVYANHMLLIIPLKIILTEEYIFHGKKKEDEYQFVRYCTYRHLPIRPHRARS